MPSGSPAQHELMVGVALTDQRPRRGDLLGLAVIDSARPRRHGRRRTRRSSYAAAILSAGKPLVGHEVKQLLVWELSRRDPERDRATSWAKPADLPGVALDTQIAAYILNAALRSQTLASIASERLEIELPPTVSLGGAEHAAVQAAAVAAAREPIDSDLTDERRRSRACCARSSCRSFRSWRRWRQSGVAIDREALGRCRPTFSSGDRPAGAGDLRGRRPPVHDRQPQAARAGPLLRAQPAARPADQDRLLNRCDGAGGAPAGAPGDRQDPRLADVHQAAQHVRRGAAAAARSERPAGLHTTFHQAVASTGRLSSTDPNLQNIPIRSELGRRIRHTFVAGGPDVVLLAADYSQIELRILAHVSGDVHLKEAFERRADIHRETAARVLKKDPADVTGDERSMAKMVNFGLAYGMSDFGLSSRGEHPARRGAGVHQLATSPRTRGSPIT